MNLLVWFTECSLHRADGEEARSHLANDCGTCEKFQNVDRDILIGLPIDAHGLVYLVTLSLSAARTCRKSIRQISESSWLTAVSCRLVGQEDRFHRRGPQRQKVEVDEAGIRPFLPLAYTLSVSISLNMTSASRPDQSVDPGDFFSYQDGPRSIFPSLLLELI